jgi:hypothetical protein
MQIIRIKFYAVLVKVVDIRFRISIIYFILSYKDRFICILLNYQSTARS